MNREADIKELIGKTFTSVINTGDDLVFTASNGSEYKFFHEQDCCENVFIDDFNGDINDLIGTPILVAEEVNNQQFEEDFAAKFKLRADGYWKEDSEGNCEPESCTWTFYKFATAKGYVDVRWFGGSNGHYSESVSFVRVK